MTNLDYAKEQVAQGDHNYAKIYALLSIAESLETIAAQGVSVEEGNTDLYPGATYIDAWFYGTPYMDDTEMRLYKVELQEKIEYEEHHPICKVNPCMGCGVEWKRRIAKLDKLLAGDYSVGS